jgi:hypothetical protein
VQPVGDPPAFLVELVATVGQQPHHRGKVILGADQGQGGRAQGDQRDRAGVSLIGLASVATIQQPHPGASLAWTSMTCSPATTSCWARW